MSSYTIARGSSQVASIGSRSQRAAARQAVAHPARCGGLFVIMVLAAGFHLMRGEIGALARAHRLGGVGRVRRLGAHTNGPYRSADLKP